MRETRVITLSSGDDLAVQTAVNYLERFMKASEHCQSYQLKRQLSAPERRVLIEWEWDTPRWRAIAWQQVIDTLADAGIEFTVSQQLSDEAVFASA